MPFGVGSKLSVPVTILPVEGYEFIIATIFLSALMLMVISVKQLYPISLKTRHIALGLLGANILLILYAMLHPGIQPPLEVAIVMLVSLLGLNGIARYIFKQIILDKLISVGWNRNESNIETYLNFVRNDEKLLIHNDMDLMGYITPAEKIDPTQFTKEIIDRIFHTHTHTPSNTPKEDGDCDQSIKKPGIHKVSFDL